MRIKLNWQGQAIMPLFLLDTEGLAPGAIKLFVALLDLREEDRDIPQREIADLLDCSATTINNWLENLAKTGWVRKSKDGKLLYLQMHRPLRRKQNGD